MNIWTEFVTYFGLDSLPADPNFYDFIVWNYKVFFALFIVIELFRAMMKAVNMFTKFR